MPRSKKLPTDVYARLRTMLPLARRIIARRGIDPIRPEITEEFSAACGHPFPADDLTTAEWEYIDGVFELGIAVGLLLDRGILDAPTGGVR